MINIAVRGYNFTVVQWLEYRTDSKRMEDF